MNRPEATSTRLLSRGGGADRLPPRSGDVHVRPPRRGTIRAAAVLAGALALVGLPTTPAAVAQTTVTCTHDTFETVAPGLTSEVAVQHHNGSGTWVCSGTIVGTPVISTAGPMDFAIRTEGNCVTERGAGTARARIPLARHDFALLRFKFAYTREANAIVITVTEGTAEVNGQEDALVWHGTLHVIPTKGDCVTEPVTAARVTGQLAGGGT